jgi:hypothetical protein
MAIYHPKDSMGRYRIEKAADGGATEILEGGSAPTAHFRCKNSDKRNSVNNVIK